MKGTLLHKLLKWIVASSVSLLALPISVFIIIFSLYPDLATFNDFKILKLKSYYNICKVVPNEEAYQKCLVDKFPNIIEPNIIEPNKNGNTINHFIFLDMTYSTDMSKKTKKIEDLFKNFRVNLIKNLTDTIKKNDKKLFLNEEALRNCDLKQIIYLNLIKNHYIYNSDTLKIYCYSGEEQYDRNNLISESNQDSIAKFLNLKVIQNKRNQFTNFQIIFDSIVPKFIVEYNNENKNRLHFFTDFFHDDTLKCRDLTYCHYETLKRTLNAKSTDLSLIALTTSAHSTFRQQTQNKMINNFHNHFDGTSFIDYLLMDKYEDNNYCVCDTCYNYEFYEIFVKNPKNDKKEIIFYSPITDLYGTNNAKAKIISKDTTNGFFWKIKPTFIENGTFMKFKKNKDSEYEERYFFNSHYEEKSENLFLDLKLDAQCNFDELKFLTIIDDNFIYSNEYNMKIKKVFIDKDHKPLLNIIIILFCILLVIVLLAGEILFIVDFIDYRNEKT